MRRSDLRTQVRERFDFCCGYCGVSETQAGAQLTLDHFQPRSQGGGNALENLVYCCHACNENKGDYWQPDAAARILHPLRDDLNEHLREQADGTLDALSDTGVFHIRRLRLNRPELIAHRLSKRRDRAADQHEADLREQLRLAEERYQSLLARIERMDKAGKLHGRKTQGATPNQPSGADEFAPRRRRSRTAGRQGGPGLH